MTKENINFKEKNPMMFNKVDQEKVYSHSKLIQYCFSKPMHSNKIQGESSRSDAINMCIHADINYHNICL